MINCLPIEIQSWEQYKQVKEKEMKGKGRKKEEEREKSEKKKTVVPSVALTSNSRTQEMEAGFKTNLAVYWVQPGLYEKKKR